MLIDTIVARVRAYPAKRGYASHRITGDLYAWYLTETPDGPKPLKESAIAALRVTRNQLHEQVVENVWWRLGGVTFHREHSGEPYTVTTGTKLTAAALLLDDLWASIAADVRGDLVVKVTSHSLLHCAGTSEPEAMAALTKGAEPRSLLRWTEQGWQPWASAGFARAA